MSKIRIYSPTQVAVGSFGGGPIATVYALWTNFRSLDNRSGAKQTIVWGSVFVVGLFLILPFLPDKFPNYAIPVAYSMTARLIAEKFQMTKTAILQSERYEFQSNWNVLGISIGFLIAFLIIAVAWLFALSSLGLWKLD